MISADFASNETWQDGLKSFSLLLQPWRWQNGPEIQSVTGQIRNILHMQAPVYTFLTGRAALYYYLQALDLPEKSEVLIQAFTCEAVPIPVIAAGMKPIYVDIEPETYSMSPEDLQNKITARSKVLILQHTFAMTPKYRNEILKLAKKHNLYIIEDLAHGWDGEPMEPDHSVLLSFGRSKSFSSVFGGAVVSSDPHVAARMDKIVAKIPEASSGFILRTLLYKPLVMIIKSTYDIFLGKLLHKIVRSTGLLVPEITEEEKDGRYSSLLSKSYPNALAILLLDQLRRFKETKQMRSDIVGFYNHKLNGRVPVQPLIRYPILVDDRDILMKRAARQNIYPGTWYDQSVSPKTIELYKVQYEPGSCPVAENICGKIINLPTTITKREAETILKLL